MAETAEQNVTQLPTVRKQQEIRVVNDPIAVLDTARFEHMQRIAMVMATSALIPESLYIVKDEDNNKVELPKERIAANCFLVVNQAVRWDMDPFAVAQCVSVVHGKLCYEGKLVAAVLQGRLGVDLEYEITGQGEAMKVVVSAAIDGKTVVDSKGRPKTVEGTVAEWKTTSSGSPWSARGGYQRMLRYRGAREWARVHSPGLMLGVYSDDELEAMHDETRASRARDVTPPPVPPLPPPAAAQKPPHDPITGEVWEDLPATETPPQINHSPQAPAPSPAPPAADKAAPSAPPPPPSLGGQSGAAKDAGPVPDFLDRRKQHQDQPTEAEPDTFDGEEWLRNLDGAFSGCESLADLGHVQKEYMTPYLPKATPQQKRRAKQMTEEHANRISGLTNMDAG